MASEKPTWIKFFETAGLPPKIASKYSSLFVEHRIQRSMLADLTKAILNEIGITAVGDVLAILKQAKEVSNKDDVEAKETVKKPPVIPKEKPAVKEKTVVALSSKVEATPKTQAMFSAVQEKRIRLERPPDHDVVYRVNMPKGTTERSRQLLQKASSVQEKDTGSPPKSVFDRLGAVVKRGQTESDSHEDEEEEEVYEDDDYLSAVPSRLRKSVSFASGTKESSPEVTSTTDDYSGRLESDKLGRKISALHRLGTKPTHEVIKVVGGERRLLSAKRNTAKSPKPRLSVHDRLG